MDWLTSTSLTLDDDRTSIDHYPDLSSGISRGRCRQSEHTGPQVDGWATSFGKVDSFRWLCDPPGGGQSELG